MNSYDATSTLITKIAEERVQILQSLYEKEDLVLRKRFEELNRQMNELSPRVTPEMLNALKETQELLNETKRTYVSARTKRKTT